MMSALALQPLVSSAIYRDATNFQRGQAVTKFLAGAFDPHHPMTVFNVYVIHAHRNRHLNSPFVHCVHFQSPLYAFNAESLTAANHPGAPAALNKRAHSAGIIYKARHWPQCEFLSALTRGECAENFATNWERRPNLELEILLAFFDTGHFTICKCCHF